MHLISPLIKEKVDPPLTRFLPQVPKYSPSKSMLPSLLRSMSTRISSSSPFFSFSPSSVFMPSFSSSHVIFPSPSQSNCKVSGSGGGGGVQKIQINGIKGEENYTWHKDNTRLRVNKGADTLNSGWWRRKKDGDGGKGGREGRKTENFTHRVLSHSQCS